MLIKNNFTYLYGKQFSLREVPFKSLHLLPYKFVMSSKIVCKTKISQFWTFMHVRIDVDRFHGILVGKL